MNDDAPPTRLRRLGVGVVGLALPYVAGLVATVALQDSLGSDAYTSDEWRNAHNVAEGIVIASFVIGLAVVAFTWFWPKARSSFRIASAWVRAMLFVGICVGNYVGVLLFGFYIYCTFGVQT